MSDFAYGQMQPEDTSSELNATIFICKQLIAQINVMKLVQVVSISPGAGSPPAAGTMSVQPLVSQLDGQGFPVPHGVVNGIKYFRIQGGQWAVICDPAVGDVGYVICADRDSSLVAKNGGGQQNPGSRRKYNIADGVYVGGVLNAVPTAYIWLKTDGTFQMVDGKGNMLETSSSGFALTGDMAVTGNITATGSIKSGFGGADQVGLQTHTHPGNNQPPTPGT